MAPASNTPPASRNQEISMESQDPRAEERKQLREGQLQKELQELERRHQEERRALWQELWEIAFARKALQHHVWKAWRRYGEEEAASNLECQEQEDGATSTAGAALNGMQGPEKWDEEKQALLELLPAKTEERVEVQRLVEVLERTALRKVYDHRINIEDPHEIKALQLKELEVTAKTEIEFVDNRKGYPKLPECFQETKKLLDIENNPIFSKTLDEWKQKEELFSLRRVHHLNQVASVKNEVYQLLAFFSVFQGVVLTAVSTSSLLHCHNMWSPIALSVLASVISTLGGIQKWNQVKKLQTTIDSEDRAIKIAVKVGKLLREPGPEGIDFVQVHREIKRDSSQQRKSSTKRRLYFLVVILTLLAFGVLFPISFWRILCKPGAPPPAQ